MSEPIKQEDLVLLTANQICDEEVDPHHAVPVSPLGFQRRI